MSQEAIPRMRVASLILALVASSSSIEAAEPAAASPAPVVPSVAEAVFHVAPGTNALVPLETVKAKDENRWNSLFCYLEGGSSPVIIVQSEAPVFVLRIDDSPKWIDRWKETSFPRRSLEQLFVEKGRRYGTKKLVDIDGGFYGDVIPGINPKKPKEVGQAFLLKPKAPLPPGEYAFVDSLTGMVEGSYPYPNCHAKAVSAFRVVAGAPAPRASAAPGSASAPTNSPADIERVRRAAEKSDPIAQLRLAQAYANGDGVPQSYEQMHRWLRAAADQGSVEAQYWRGVLFRDAVGVAADPAQAAQLFRKAADQGHGLAQGNLGHLYALGQGVLQDYVEAHKWLNVAASRLSGDERKQCVEMRDKVAAQMTAAQVAEAQKRATEWVEAFGRAKP
jgi:hypothetical protein